MVDRSIIAMGDRYVVRWMRYRGTYPALDYLTGLGAESGMIRERLDALAYRMAQHGALPSRSHGHWLAPPFGMIYEFKPSSHRFLGFLHGSQLYLTNGAPKRNAKAQTGDYIIAANRRLDFLAQLAPYRDPYQ